MDTLVVRNESESYTVELENTLDERLTVSVYDDDRDLFLTLTGTSAPDLKQAEEFFGASEPISSPPHTILGDEIIIHFKNNPSRLAILKAIVATIVKLQGLDYKAVKITDGWQ